MIELFDKVKNFILGEPEEEYEEEYNDNYGEEYENEQEVSNGSNVRSFGSSFGGFTQKNDLKNYRERLEYLYIVHKIHFLC